MILLLWGVINIFVYKFFELDRYFCCGTGFLTKYLWFLKILAVIFKSVLNLIRVVSLVFPIVRARHLRTASLPPATPKHARAVTDRFLSYTTKLKKHHVLYRLFCLQSNKIMYKTISDYSIIFIINLCLFVFKYFYKIMCLKGGWKRKTRWLVFGFPRICLRLYKHGMLTNITYL